MELARSRHRLLSPWFTSTLLGLGFSLEMKFMSSRLSACPLISIFRTSILMFSTSSFCPSLNIISLSPLCILLPRVPSPW